MEINPRFSMKVALDARGAAAAYSRAFQHLKTLPGFDHTTVLRAEAGSILKRWAGLAKVATEDQIDRRTRARLAREMGMQSAGSEGAFGGVTINNGARGGFRGEVWFRTRHGKFQPAGRILAANDNFVPAWTHFRAPDWTLIRSAGETYAARLGPARRAALQSVGLTRQSIVQIADALGIDLAEVKGQGLSAAGLAKARAALASNGRNYKNGFGLAGGDGVKAYVELINRLPFGTSPRVGLDAKLKTVLLGRTRYLQTSYQKGALESFARAQRAFPEIFRVNPGAYEAL
ncbi:MAG: hypothetical protein EBT69_01725, partial [Verrucomicrobia bacterium]|nr:hypothetical protein [Verrucomicrobiota bacterium]